jgi:hypothetical protein
MTVTTISLDAFEQAERELARVDARRGITVHAIITAVVSIALIAINVFVAPAFPWSAFAVAGMGAGLAFHYYFGFRRVDEHVLEHQRAVELRLHGLG